MYGLLDLERAVHDVQVVGIEPHHRQIERQRALATVLQVLELGQVLSIDRLSSQRELLAGGVPISREGVRDGALARRAGLAHALRFETQLA